MNALQFVKRCENCDGQSKPTRLWGADGVETVIQLDDDCANSMGITLDPAYRLISK